ncbi:MAG: hypothetical protein E6Q59_03720 [Nitrosomonas sp.]|nr:MAG: hypothetical protein E6Q59_03720 [Nitrosomonas sp.]
MDEWRLILYYPLGILPTIFFSLRFLLQWVQSEKVQQSVVFPLFWRLSLAGNLIALTHYFIQMQFPFVIIQGINAVISWRNLDLMRPEGSTLSTRATLSCLAIAIAGLTTAFTLQGILFGGNFEWTHTPAKLMAVTPAPLIWHVIGTIGAGLFASRFWVQWYQAERQQQSRLNRTFWWLSITGNVLSLAYFGRIGDTVSIINNAFCVVPALRNLMLIARRSQLQES